MLQKTDSNLLKYMHDIIIPKVYKDPQSSSFKTSVSIMRTFARSAGLVSVRDLDVKYRMALNNLQTSKRAKETKRKIAYFMALAYKELQNVQAQKDFVQLYMQYKMDIQKAREKNKAINEKEMRCLQNINLKDLRAKPIDFGMMTPDDLLYNLLVRMDETPRLEYRLLRYNNYTPAPNVLKSSNFLIVTPNGQCELVLSKYKTFSTYGTWRINIARKYPELARYIEQYIEYHKLPTGAILFLNTANKPYPSNKFSEHVQTVFEKKIGQRISMNCFRKIKVNALFHQNPNILKMSLEEQKKWIEDHFRHSLANSMLYYKRVDHQPELMSIAESYKSLHKTSPTPSMRRLDEQMANLAISPPKKKRNNKKSKKGRNRLWNFRDELHTLMDDYDVNVNEVTKLLSKQLLI